MQANLSDRLIRKAESGGRVDLETVSTLASLYSSPHRQISPADLIENSSIDAAGELLDEVLVLRCWMDEIWNKKHLAVLEDLAADRLCFQCESGVVTTRRELQDRYRRIQRQYSRVECHVEELAGSNGFAVCRWKMSMWHVCPERADRSIQGATKVSGSTSVQVEFGKVVEGSEFWHPQHAYQTIVES